MINYKSVFKFLMIVSVAFLIFSFGQASHAEMPGMNSLSQNQKMNAKSVEDGCIVLFEGAKVCLNDLFFYIKSFLLNNANLSIFTLTISVLIFFNKKEIMNFYKEIKLSRKFLYQKLLFYFENTKSLILCHLETLFKSGILNPKTH